jgi:hypothetical protein
MAMKKETGKKPKAKMASKSIKSNVVSRAKTVAREVRDIPTELGTKAKYKSGMVTDGPKGNVKKQLKDVGKALTTGKAGSTPNVIARSQSQDKSAKPRGKTASSKSPGRPVTKMVEKAADRSYSKVESKRMVKPAKPKAPLMRSGKSKPSKGR